MTRQPRSRATVLPDRTPDQVDATVVRRALHHLEQHGLRFDGELGDPGGPCSVDGHVAAAVKDRHLAEVAVDAAFRRWPGRPDVARACGCVVCWNDLDQPTVPEAAAFYRWWIANLEGGA